MEKPFSLRNIQELTAKQKAVCLKDLTRRLRHANHLSVCMVNELLGFSVELEAIQSLRTLWG